jgi:branched-chain amino acid transport system ATP-binding protein
VKALCGLLIPRSGRVSFDGKEITGLPASEVARRGLCLCPEGRRVFGQLTVEENLLLGAYPRLPSFGPFRRAASSDLKHIYGMSSRLGERRLQQVLTSASAIPSVTIMPMPVFPVAAVMTAIFSIT